MADGFANLSLGGQHKTELIVGFRIAWSHGQRKPVFRRRSLTVARFE